MNDHTLAPGTRVGPYEVLVPLEGGELRGAAGGRKNDEPITFLADASGT